MAKNNVDMTIAMVERNLKQIEKLQSFLRVAELNQNWKAVERTERRIKELKA